MYYFAYGSNMHHEQMKERCSESRFLKRAFLKYCKFVYDGVSDTREGPVANIIETGKESDIVWGGLFEISLKDLKKLDEFEGYPKHYIRKNFKIEDEAKKFYDAVVYFRVGEKPGKPHKDYRKTVIEGAKNCNLPLDYIVNNLR